MYVARLANTPVFDPNGDQVGRMRDVVLLMLGSDRVRASGFVVEVPGRRRIFLPITRIVSIDAGQVVTTGLLNMRRFEKRSGETLVIGEVLDRTVTIIDSGSAATIVDVALEQTRTRDWLLAKLAVRENSGRRLRRRGHSHVVDADAVTGLTDEQPGQGADQLLVSMDTMRAADVASTLTELTPQRRAEVAAALDDERLADVLEELPEEVQVEILGQLRIERAADVLAEMGPDDAADLLAELPAEQAERLLAVMEPKEADPVRRLLTYSDDTAGGMMTSEPVILGPDGTVAEALARIRNPDISPAAAAMVFVCRPPLETPTGRFLGMAHFQRLLREPPSALVSGVCDSDIEPIGPDASLAEVASHLATYNLVASPVVDDDDRLLGAVTVDDVLDHLLPDDWRDPDTASRPQPSPEVSHGP